MTVVLDSVEEPTAPLAASAEVRHTQTVVLGPEPESDIQTMLLGAINDGSELALTPRTQSRTTETSQGGSSAAAGGAVSGQHGTHQGQKWPQAADPLGAAIAAAQAGNKPLACLQLGKAIQAQPDNPICWLWLAWTSDSPSTAISALDHAQLLAPHDALVKLGLRWARAMQGFDAAQLVGGERVGGVEEPDRVAAAHATVVSTDSAQPDASGSADPNGEKIAAADWAPGDAFGAGVAKTCAWGTVERAADGAPEEGFTNRQSADRISGVASLSSSDNAVLPGWGLGIAATATTELPDAVSEAIPEVIAEESAGESLLQEFAKVYPEVVESGADSGSNDRVEAVKAPSQATILAVDDSPTIRELVSMILSKHGYNVITATDGVNALKCITACKPSLILMDIDMPRLNGYKLCKLVKHHKDTRKIPVIMLSGKDRLFDKYRGRLCGCDGYITKPFESADLVKKVLAHLPETPPAT